MPRTTATLPNADPTVPTDHSSAPPAHTAITTTLLLLLAVVAVVAAVVAALAMERNAKRRRGNSSGATIVVYDMIMLIHNISPSIFVGTLVALAPLPMAGPSAAGSHNKAVVTSGTSSAPTTAPSLWAATETPPPAKSETIVNTPMCNAAASAVFPVPGIPTMVTVDQRTVATTANSKAANIALSSLLLIFLKK